MANKERNFVYSDKIKTDIFLEEPSKENPYIAKNNYIHGYNTLELAQKKSFSASLYLLFVGELPSTEQESLLNVLLIGFMNLGPRHPAVKAAMVAGVSKTNAEHLLPIGLSVAGGKENAAGEVFSAMQFIKEHQEQPIEPVIDELMSQYNQTANDGSCTIAPGFGQSYGGIDLFTAELASLIEQTCENLTAFPTLQWTFNFVSKLNKYGFGWQKSGLAAAVFIELGISERQGIGLFQLICAPGIFAQGVEQMHKPITAIPMPSDEQHVYQPKQASKEK